MAITKISSRSFNQDAGGAKRAADRGPVIITDRGRPAHVLLSYADYEKLLGRGPSLVEALAQSGVQSGGDDIHFEPARLTADLARPVDFD